MATPKTMSIGISSRYSTCGASKGAASVRPAVLEASVAPITSRSLRRPAPAARGR